MTELLVYFILVIIAQGEGFETYGFSKEAVCEEAREMVQQNPNILYVSNCARVELKLRGEAPK